MLAEALINKDGYKILFLLHILSAIVAFGPLFAVSALQRSGRTAELARLYLYVCLPALVLTWVFGMGLVGMSKPAGSDEAVIKMSQTWIVLAVIVWLIAVVIGAVLIRPALTDRSAQARSRLSAGIGVTHLCLIVLLYLMVFKPGF